MKTGCAEWLKAQPAELTVIDAEPRPAPPDRKRTIRRQYSRPYIAHGSIAPSCAMAQWTGNRVHVWTHSQGVYLLRADLALVLKLPLENITVEHLEGAGCYGHNAADDAALDAVLLAKAAGGRPVRVQWSRESEMSHAPFGAAMAIEIEADLDAGGEIVDWRHSIWSNGHAARPGRATTPALLAATELSNPFPRIISTNPPQANGGGADRNSIPPYDLPAWRIECHRLPTMPVRTSALRTLGAQGNVFAVEFVHRRNRRRTRRRSGRFPPPSSVGRAGQGCDPCRRPRELEAGQATRSRLRARLRALQEHRRLLRRRRRVEVTEDIRVNRLTIAVDVGEAINPDGVINQIEGGAIQATSWVLKERVRFDRQRITSNTWSDYPILRFSEVPEVQVEIIQRPGDRAGRRRRGGPRPRDGSDRQCGVRCAGGAGSRPADHPRQPCCGDGIESVSSLNILSGGAAQGLVGSLAPTFKVLTGFDITGEFGAVGAMADKLRNGAAADIVILTAAIVAKLATEKLVVPSSIADVGLVETALAVRAGEPQVTATDAATLREALLAADAIFVPDTRASTAGIHVAKVLHQLGIAEQVSARLKIFPNGATAMRQLAASDADEANRLHPVDRDHQHPRAWCCRDRCRRAATSRPCIRQR